MKQKERIVRALEQFSTAMLAALGYLPAAGLVLAAGALLASAGLGSVAPVLRWEPLALAGSLAYDGMMAIIQNLSVVFCVGIAAFLARKEKQQAAIIALLSYLVFLTAGHTTLEQMGRLAAPDPALGMYGTGQAVVLGIQTMDMGGDRRHPAGLPHRVGLQPHQRQDLPPGPPADLWRSAVELFVHGGAVGRPGAGRLLCLAARPAGGGRPHRLDRRGRGDGPVPLWFSGAGAHPHRAAPPDLYPVPVHIPGRHPDGGEPGLHRRLRGHDGGVQPGPALQRRHPVDVHRLHQDLWVFRHRGGLHFLRPPREPAPHRGHADPRCCSPRPWPRSPSPWISCSAFCPRCCGWPTG